MTEDNHSLEAWLDEAEQNILREVSAAFLRARDLLEAEKAKPAPKKRAPRKKKAVKQAEVDAYAVGSPSEALGKPVDPVEEFRALAMGNLSKAGRLVRTEGGSRFTDLSAAKQTKVLEELRNG